MQLKTRRGSVGSRKRCFSFSLLSFMLFCPSCSYRNSTKSLALLYLFISFPEGHSNLKLLAHFLLLLLCQLEKSSVHSYNQTQLNRRLLGDTLYSPCMFLNHIPHQYFKLDLITHLGLDLQLEALQDLAKQQAEASDTPAGRSEGQQLLLTTHHIGHLPVISRMIRAQMKKWCKSQHNLCAAYPNHIFRYHSLMLMHMHPHARG